MADPVRSFKAYREKMDPYIEAMTERLGAELGREISKEEMHAYIGWCGQMFTAELVKSVQAAGDNQGAELILRMLQNISTTAIRLYRQEQKGVLLPPTKDEVYWDTPEQHWEMVNDKTLECLDPHCEVHTPKTKTVDQPVKTADGSVRHNGYL